jgi:CheY-like chemotaxis protein
MELTRTQSYDLILMDLQMPVMDGLQASRLIRDLPGRASVPIVALTANVLPEHRQQCLAAGMNDFLGKPVEAEQLAQCVLHWTHPRHTTGTDRAAERPVVEGLATPPATVSPPPIDPEEQAATWQTLMALIRSQDIAALAVLDQALPWLEPRLGAEVHQLEQRLLEFDFEAALVLASALPPPT